MWHRASLKNPRAVTRAKAASDPSCPPQLLEELAGKEESEEVLLAIAGNSASTSIALARVLQRTKRPHVLDLVVVHPNTDAATRLKAAHDTWFTMKVLDQLAANQPVDPAVVTALALPRQQGLVGGSQASTDARKAAATHKDINVIRGFAGTQDLLIREQILHNENAPLNLRQDIMRSLLKQGDELFLRELAYRRFPDAPADVIDNFVTNPDPVVRRNVLRRTDLRPGDLEKLLQDPVDYVREAAAQSPAMPKRLLKELVYGHNNTPLSALIRNPTLNEEEWLHLLRRIIDRYSSFPGWKEVENYVPRVVIAQDSRTPAMVLPTLATLELEWYSTAPYKTIARGCNRVLEELEKREDLATEVREQIRSRTPTSRMQLPESPPSNFGSPPEELFWKATQTHATPTLLGLVPQFAVGKYRLDFALPSKKLGIEVDGLAFHGSQESILLDRKRQRELEMQGWRLLRFTALEVMQDPDDCASIAAKWVESL